MAIVCGVNTIDSNAVGLSYAEEACYKVLDTPTWRGLEPNSYASFGANVKTVARQPINPSRQLKRGRVSDIDATAAFNMDFVKGAWTHLMQGFMFADARQKPTTSPLNGATITVNSVASKVATLSAALAGVAGSNTLMVGSGFGNPAIDGVLLSVASVAGAAITFNEAIPDVPAPPAAAAFRVVGAKTTNSVATVTNGQLSITNSPNNVIPGEWMFIQGPTKNLGFGRVLSVNGTTLTFDRTAFTPQAETGAFNFFQGTVLRSEDDPNNIKRRTYQLERTLGKDASGVQSEYVTGAVPNTLAVNIPSADKINADFAFVAGGKETRTGLVGVKAGTRIPSKGETAFNTSSDVVRMRLTLESDTNSDATPLFGYASDGTINVNNNITATKAVGTLGAFDASSGNFEANGSVTAYFTTVTASDAVMHGAEAGLYTIAAVENQGIVFDLPSLTLGGGELKVELNKPITVPLTSQGAQSKFGHTMLFQHFPYLPNAAMPS